MERSGEPPDGERASRSLEILLGHIELVCGDGAGLGKDPAGCRGPRLAVPRVKDLRAVCVHAVRRPPPLSDTEAPHVSAIPELGRRHGVRRPARQWPWQWARAGDDLPPFPSSWNRGRSRTPTRRRVVERRNHRLGAGPHILNVRRQGPRRGGGRAWRPRAPWSDPGVVITRHARSRTWKRRNRGGTREKKEKRRRKRGTWRTGRCKWEEEELGSRDKKT